MPKRDQWVFLKPCGCPVGVMEGYLADTAGEAMSEMYDRNKDLRRAVATGIKVHLISFAEYEQKYFEKMRPSYTCPHGAAA